MKKAIAARTMVEVDLEVYLTLRKLAEAAEMWDFHQGSCEEEDTHHLGLVSDRIEKLIALDGKIYAASVPHGEFMRRSTDWRYALPLEVLKDLEKRHYDFRHPEFEHEACACSEEDDETSD